MDGVRDLDHIDLIEKKILRLKNPKELFWRFRRIVDFGLKFFIKDPGDNV